MIRSSGLLMIVLAVLAIASCGDDEGERAEGPAPGQNFEAEHLERFALKQSDLPDGYEETQRALRPPEEVLITAKTSKQMALAKRLVATGLKNFYGVGYSRREGARHSEPGSMVLRYRSPRRASKALPLVRRYFAANVSPRGRARTISTRRNPTSDLGDESLPGIRFSAPGSGLKYFVYVWRTRNVVAALGWGDAFGDVTAQSLLATAMRLDFRATRHTSD